MQTNGAPLKSHAMTRAAWSLLGYWASFSWCQLRDRYSAAKRRPNLGQGALRHVRYLAGLGDSAETHRTDSLLA